MLQDTAAASLQADPEYLSDCDNGTQSFATDDFLCSKLGILSLCAHACGSLPASVYYSFLSRYITADHNANGDSCSDGENEDFAMVEDQTGRLTCVGIELE